MKVHWRQNMQRYEDKCRYVQVKTFNVRQKPQKQEGAKKLCKQLSNKPQSQAQVGKSNAKCEGDTSNNAPVHYSCYYWHHILLFIIKY